MTRALVLPALLLAAGALPTSLAPAMAQPAFPYPLVETTGDEALATWEGLHGADGATPVIIGDREDLEHLREDFGASLSRHPRSTLEAAKALVHTETLDAHRAAEAARANAMMIENGVATPADIAAWDADDARIDREVLQAPWPNAPQANPGLLALRDGRSGALKPQVLIALLPTDDPAETPAYLKLGGWNAHPPAEHHVAAFRSWGERYGAVPVLITADTIEMRVARRPETREEALELAAEMYRYAEDIVLQTEGGVADLAASLMVSDWWFFWWD